MERKEEGEKRGKKEKKLSAGEGTSRVSPHTRTTSQVLTLCEIEIATFYSLRPRECPLKHDIFWVTF